MRDTAAFVFPDQAQLLTLLSSQVGANVDPLSSWIRDSRITAQPGPHKQQKWWTEQAGLHTKAYILKDSTPRDAVRISQNTGFNDVSWHGSEEADKEMKEIMKTEKLKERKCLVAQVKPSWV